MKKATLQIILIMLFTPFILAQTTHRYLENFDSGIAEGWVFYTDASVSVQNGHLRVQSSSPDFQIAHIYPPIGATINNFSVEYSSDASSIAEGGFVGRLGFNSLIGALYEDDTVRVVYAVNISNFYAPDFVTLYSYRLNDNIRSGKIQVNRSGADLAVSFSLNDTLRYSGNLVNAPESLFKGHLMLSVVGDSLDFTLSSIDFNYVPYLSDQSTSYFESFNDAATPWYKYGTWDKVGQAITINNGSLNLNKTGTDYVSMYAGSPVGSVSDFDFTGSFVLTNPTGFFGMYRLYSLRYYTGVMYDGDTLMLVYQDGGSGEPKIITQAAANLNLYSSFRLTSQRTGNNILFRAYGNTTQLLSGTLVTSDPRLYYGHLIYGFDTDENLSVSFPDATISFMKFITDVEDEASPVQFNLARNYPNPFNPSTRIRFTLGKPGFTDLVVYDALGRECAVLVKEELESGLHEVVFDASPLSGGVYFYRLKSGGNSASGKMILLK